MGFQDRDYYRSGRSDRYASGSDVGKLRAWSVTTWLIVINVAVFLVDAFLLRSGVVAQIPTGQQVPGPDGSFRTVVQQMAPLEGLGHFSAATAIWGGQVWRFLTFQFLHANLQHLLFNMLGLYFFGQMMETYLGRERFLGFYLTCGVAGAVLYLALWGVGMLVGSAWVPLVGASAGIFGILAAAARVAPNATVMLIFPPMPVQLRTWAMILLGLAAATILFAGPNAGGEAAHLGGALLGYFGVEYARTRTRMRIAR